MKHRTVLVLAAALTFGAPAAADAQFTSDLAGVPRASLSERGPYQGRLTWDMAGFRTPESQGHSRAGRVHLGYGLSRRFGSWLELGGDFAAVDGYFTRRPATAAAAPDPDPETRADTRGYFTTSLFYSARLGLKVQPYSFVAPDGNRVDVALGVSYQPSLRPVIALLHKGDSTVVSGIFGETHPEMNAVHGVVQVALMGSYRADRVLADLALIHESASNAADSPVDSFAGLAPRLGAKFRLTRAAWVGFSWWTAGAPPWRDRIAAGTPEEKRWHFAPVLSLGPNPEKSTDLIITSPTGALNRSLRLHIQTRWAY